MTVKEEITIEQETDKNREVEAVFELGNLDIAYGILDNMDSLRNPNPDAGQAYRESLGTPLEAKLRMLRNIGGVSYDPAILKTPLKMVGFYAERIGSIFAASVVFIPEEDSKHIFSGMDRMLTPFLEERGYGFEYKNNRGCITDDEGNRYVIFQQGNQTHLCMGNHGAYTRTFPASDGDESGNQKVFTSAIRELELIANEIGLNAYKSNDLQPFSKPVVINPF